MVVYSGSQKVWSHGFSRLSFAALLMSYCPSSLAPPKSQDCVGLRKGFVTSKRSINLSFALASFLAFTKSGGTYVGRWLVGQVVRQLVSFAPLKLLYHLFCFVRSRTVRSIHTAMYKDTSNDKIDKAMVQTGVRLKGGCPPCLAPGVGGTLSIKVLQVPIGIAAFDGNYGSTFVSFPPQTKVEFFCLKQLVTSRVHISTLTNLFVDPVNC